MKRYSKKKKNDKFRKIYLYLILIIILISFVEGVDLYRNKNKIYPGVYAFNIPLGGVKKEEAQEKLQPIVSKIINSPRILVFEEEKIKFIPGSDLDASIDLSQIVEKSYNVARTGNIFKRWSERVILWRKGYQVSFQVIFNQEKLKKLQKDIGTFVNRASGDAYIENNKIIESVTGIELNLTEFNSEVLKNLSCIEEEAYTIYIPTTANQPQFSTQDLLKKYDISQILGSYNTSLENKEENTKYNIKLSSTMINGVLLKPQETFSFNKYVGPAEKEDGFKESVIIANGRFENGYGGGVCQVSSTLYNAVLLSNLQIVERYNHSIYGDATRYVPLGRDAAIFYGYKDLRFKNNLGHDIVVFAKIFGDNLQVEILGRNENKPEIEIINKDIKTIDYQIIRNKDSNLKPGQEVIEQEGMPGYQVKTYRIIKKSDGEKIEFLYEDTYKSVPMIIREN